MRPDGSRTRRLTRSPRNDARPSWSPDGSRIVFDRGAWGDLYTIGVAGRGLRRLTSDPAQETDPAWSPDGRWIAYVRRERGTRVHEIWLVRPDGSQAHALTRLGVASYSPAWSPDGRRVVFASNLAAYTWGIYAVARDGTRLERLIQPVGEGSFEPAWSPDGTRLAFARAGAVVVSDAAGHELARSRGGNDGSPAWRPEQSPRP
jgi:TolB protein